MSGLTRRLVIAAVALALALAVPLTATALAGSAVAAAAPTKSGLLTLGTTSGSITGTLTLTVTPAAGAGRQVCDPANDSYGVVYASAPGHEDGVAGELVNYTILAPADGSLIPAGGTVTQFLPTVMDPVFPASGASTPLDSSTNGTFSLGVRCQDGASTQIFQNYWTTITIRNGTWTLGGADPTTTSTGSSSATGSTTSTTPAASSTSTSPTGPVRAGTLAVLPTNGRLLAGTYNLAARPTTAGAQQVCGDVQSFAVLYFAPPGHEFDPVGGAGGIKARPVQASGLDIPLGGSLVSFLPTAGVVDFSQSLGASDSWQQPLTAGRFSLGVRCQSGLADAPVIYQNYFAAVTVAADGSWSVDGAPGPTTTPPTTVPITTGPAGALTLSVADAAGHLLRGPLRVTAGAHLFISASGFVVSENVLIAVHSTPVTLATVPAVNGGIAAAIVLPKNLPPGTHTLSVTGSTSRRSGTLTLTVTSPALASTATTTAVITTRSTAATSTAATSTTTTSTTPTTATTDDPPFTTANPFAPNNNAGSGSLGSLAYTGFPVSGSLTTAALLLGFGIALFDADLRLGCQGAGAAP